MGVESSYALFLEAPSIINKMEIVEVWGFKYERLKGRISIYESTLHGLKCWCRVH